MLYSVPSDEKAKAVQYLIDRIPDETMPERSRCHEVLPYQDHERQGAIMARDPMAVLRQVRVDVAGLDA